MALKQSWTSIVLREHHEDAAAKRVVSMPNGGITVAYENTSFVTIASPAVHSVFTDLGRNGIEGYVMNDGPGDFTVEFSEDGSIYGGDHTLKNNEVLNFDALSVNKIRINWGADSAYRIFVV